MGKTADAPGGEDQGEDFKADLMADSRVEKRIDDRGSIDQTTKPTTDPADPISPVTNQPLSDFAPKGLEGEDLKAAQLINANRSVATGDAMIAVTEELIETRKVNAELLEANKEILKAVKKDNAQMLKDLPHMDPNTYRARQQALVHAEAATIGTSTVQVGGRYLVNNRWVDAFGNFVD